MRFHQNAFRGLIAFAVLSACPPQRELPPLPTPPQNQLVSRVVVGGLLAGVVTAGIDILLTGPEIRSGGMDSFGRISHRNLLPGQYVLHITASATREQSLSATVDVPANGTVSVPPFEFHGIAGLTGVVVSRSEIIPGALVEVMGGPSTTADSNGSFTFHDIDSGHVTLTTSVSGTSWTHTDTVALTIGYTGQLVVDLGLPPPGGVSGLAFPVSSIGGRGDLETDGTQLYASGGETSTGIFKIDPLSNVPTQVTSAPIAFGALHIDGDQLLVADLGSENHGTGTRYLHVTGTGAVVSMPVAGGATSTIATGETEPYGVTANADSYFWINLLHNAQGTPASTDSSVIMRRPRDLSTEATAIAGTDDALSFVLDDAALYWTTGNTKELLTVPLAGGEVATLATDWGNAKVLRDSGHLYLSNAECLAEVTSGSDPVILLRGLHPVVFGGTAYWMENTEPGYFFHSKALPNGDLTTLYSSGFDYQSAVASEVVVAGDYAWWVENDSSLMQFRMPTRE